MNKIVEDQLLTSDHADELDTGLSDDFKGIALVRLAADCALNNKNRH